MFWFILGLLLGMGATYKYVVKPLEERLDRLGRQLDPGLPPDHLRVKYELRKQQEESRYESNNKERPTF